MKLIILLSAVIISLGFCFLTKYIGILAPVAVIAISVFIGIQIAFIKNTKTVIWVLLFYAFTYPIFDREIGGGFQYGILQEGILILGWGTIIFTSNKYNWKLLDNDLVILMLTWFIISFLEVGNPAGASVLGWLQEIRAAALYPILVVPLCYLLFKGNKDLNVFIVIMLTLSLLGSFNGIKQLYLGPSPGEQRFLDHGGALTHILFGKLRVFSFYTEAGQFGASQAAVGCTTLVLSFGPYKKWKKAVLFIAAMFMLNGMLISGTRGALSALLVAGVVAIALSKKFKIMIIGAVILGSFIFILKFTNIGNGNYQMVRLRSGLDPKEASFNVRLNSQRILSDYLASRPFGGGLGVIGAWGKVYNADKFLSRIQPDSYWVKVWAMYGIVGFIIWFGIMVYILGKCCGIIWNIENSGLRIKLIALAAGYAGILFCSYGNEVINTTPSSYIIYISWVFIFMGPKLDEELKNKSLN